MNVRYPGPLHRVTMGIEPGAKTNLNNSKQTRYSNKQLNLGTCGPAQFAREKPH